MKYNRIILKLSGEALAGKEGFGVDSLKTKAVLHDIKTLNKAGVEIGIVVGGGNFIRGGRSSFHNLIDRATADQMGMLSTMINALAIRDILKSMDVKSEISSAKTVDGALENISCSKLDEKFKKKTVIVFAGGTGNPFVTTDSAAALRAIENHCDIILKATTVNGVYDSDPKTNVNAKKYSEILFENVIKQRLNVMDISAFTQCQEFNIPICVFDLTLENALIDIVNGNAIGTLVS